MPFSRSGRTNSEELMQVRPVPVALILLFLLSVPSGLSLFAQSDAFLQPQGKAEVWLSGGGGSTKTIFDTDGRQRLFDTAGTTFGAYVLTVSVDYGLADNLELNASLPLGYLTLRSDVKFPDRSILAPLYLGLGATWGLRSGPLRGALTLQLRIPPGFHDGIYDDPNHPTFLSDGYLELLAGVAAAWSSDAVWVKGTTGVSLRAEEPADHLFAAIEVGHSRVEGTGVFIGLEGVTSLSDPAEPLFPFYAGADGDLEEFSGGTGRMRTIDRESYLVIAPGAFFNLGAAWTISSQYRVRLLGLHTVRLNGLYVGAGHRF